MLILRSVSAQADDDVYSATTFHGTGDRDSANRQSRYVPVTRSDVGFSPRPVWADLRSEVICPAPSDIDTPPKTGVGENDPLAEEDRLLRRTPESDSPIPEQDKAEAKVAEVEDPRHVRSEGLMSFEQWKRVQSGEEPLQTEVASHGSDRNGRNSTDGHAAIDETTPSDSIQSEPFSHAPHTSTTPSAGSTVSPKAHAPSHNRYNYASPDCSARIHSSSPQTQHASSLLHTSRDRYMLTPCKADEHWVVVELCDDIRIEAVDIAIWEFFSGIIRDVRISVSGGEDDEEDTEEETYNVTEHNETVVRGRSSRWKEVGAFIGKNVRGVQVSLNASHPAHVQTFSLTGPTRFHRFIRLDFPTHYGTEYYCPVSQVKVFGMNQMEAFKWEQRQISAAAKERERFAAEVEIRDGMQRVDTHEVEEQGINRTESSQEVGEIVQVEASVRQQATPLEVLLITITPKETFAVQLEAEASSTIPSDTDASSKTISTQPSTPPTESIEVFDEPKTSHVLVSSPAASFPARASANMSEVLTPLDPTISQPLPAVSSNSRAAQPPRADSSESIYAFITRRLDALEGNSSMVVRYIDEQSRLTKLMLDRVVEEWSVWKKDWANEDHRRWDQDVSDPIPCLGDNLMFDISGCDMKIG